MVRTQDEFLAAAAHDLKNPAQAVRLAEGAFGDRETARWLVLVVWLVELGYLTDHMRVRPVRVQRPRGHGRLAYWTLKDGVVELATW